MQIILGKKIGLVRFSISESDKKTKMTKSIWLILLYFGLKQLGNIIQKFKVQSVQFYFFTTV